MLSSNCLSYTKTFDGCNLRFDSIVQVTTQMQSIKGREREMNMGNERMKDI